MRWDRLFWIVCALALAVSAAATDVTKGPWDSRRPRGEAGPASAFIESAIDPNGQFTFGVPGGPVILYGHPSPWSSYTTIQVDGTNYDNDGQAFGTTLQDPTTSGNTSEGIWAVGSTGLQVHQLVTLVRGYSTNEEDTYLITYRLVNNGSSARQVGLRIMFDTDLAGNDGAPFQVPGTGSVTTAKTWLEANVPPYFFVFNDLNDPEVTAQASLSGGEIVLAPDKLVIAPWGCGSSSGGLYGNAWDYVTQEEDVTCDSAYAVFWLPRTVAPGASVDFATYYGLGGIEVDANPPLVSSTTAPVYLDCHNFLTPNPFTVSLYLENSVPGTSSTVTGITATIHLPAGLRVAPGSETQQVADMAPSAGALLSWSVLADGTARGELPYTIEVDSVSAGSKSTTRAIYVPPGCPTGDLPPVVGMTSPAAGAQLSCVAVFQATVWDDAGSATVQYYLDDQPVGPALSTSPFNYSVQLGAEANGQHVVYAIARDGSGQETKSNKVQFSVSNPAITSVEYKGASKVMKVYGDNLKEGYQVLVNGVSQNTLFKTKSLAVYKTDFKNFNTSAWVVEGTVYQHTRNDGTKEVRLEPDSSMARGVSTAGYKNIRVSLHYAYRDMDEGEGVLLEYSTQGPDGPWLGGFSDLSARPNGSTDGWRRGLFYAPEAAADNGQFWVRVRNVRTQNHLGPDGLLRVDDLNVVSLVNFLKVKGAPKIGPAQTVPVAVRYENCQTGDFLYTRP